MDVVSVSGGDESAKPVNVRARPLADFAAQAEVRAFGALHQHADVALACGVHGLAQGRPVSKVNAVERRIGENDAADGGAAFETNGAHGADLLLARSGHSRCEGRSASR